MSPIFFAWVASIVYGVQNIVGKVATKNSIKNPWLLNFLWQGFALILILPLALYFDVQLPQEWASVLWGGFFWAVTTMLYLCLLKMFDASVVGSLYNFRTAIVPLLGVFWLGEMLTGYQVLFIGLIFLGGMFVTIDERFSLRAFFRPAMLMVIPAIVSSAFLNSFVKISIGTNGYWTATLWIIIIAQVILCFTAPLFWRDMKSMPAKSYRPIVLFAVLSVVADLAANYAYADNISISGAIMALPFSMIFAVILSWVAPRFIEHHTFKVYAIRIAAAAVMVFAAIRLS